MASQSAELDATKYRKIGYDELVTYAIGSISERNEEITFEGIVAECFRLFPERFALRGYPQWPDSAVVNKSWLRCRTDKHYIVGSVRAGFRLTPQGAKVVQRVGAQLAGRRPIPPMRGQAGTEARTRQGRLIRALEQSPVVDLYVKTGSIDHMTEYDFCDILMCTIETDPSVLKASLRQYQDAAQSYDREELVRFLEACETRFVGLLHKAGTDRYEGGMVRRKRARRKTDD